MAKDGNIRASVVSQIVSNPSPRNRVLVYGRPDSPEAYAIRDLLSRSGVAFDWILYPTGEPLLVSARQLRNDLERVCQLVDPSGKNALLRQMVVVGHSMGGLLSHTLVSDSGDLIWSALSTKPFDQLRLSASDRAELKEMMFFEPNSHIKRVVFMAVPHRGSGLAKGLVGAIGSRLTHSPKDTFDLVKRVAAENPGICSDQFNRMIHSGAQPAFFRSAQIRC